jgi:hypothetical protein
VSPTPQENFFAAILLLSREQHLDFLLVGGNAVNAHGYQRTTFDIDLAIPDDQLHAWRKALEGMGYRMYFATEAFQRYQGMTDSNLFPVDLMLLSPETFSKLQKSSIPRQVGTVELPIPAALHLVAMKLHALRQPERARQGKDLPDVIGLIRCSQIDVQGNEFQAMVDKYADAPTRAALFRLLEAPPGATGSGS